MMSTLKTCFYFPLPSCTSNQSINNQISTLSLSHKQRSLLHVSNALLQETERIIHKKKKIRNFSGKCHLQVTRWYDKFLCC